MSDLPKMATNRPRHWGFWSSLGISTLIIIGFSLIGILVAVVYMAWELSQNPTLVDEVARTKFMATLNQNGNFLAWNTICSGGVGLGLVAIAVKVKRGLTYRDYLNLSLPKWHAFVIWNVLLVALIWVESKVAEYFSKTSDFMENIFASDHTNLVLLSLAVVVMASIFEEVLFRGFLFKGLENSWLGTAGTIVVTSLLWAIIHLQYEPFFMGIIFVLGLLLGYARHVTKSLWIPISMHSLNNALAMVSASGWLHSILLS